jgi:hypothetical protein
MRPMMHAIQPKGPTWESAYSDFQCIIMIEEPALIRDAHGIWADGTSKWSKATVIRLMIEVSPR